MRLKVLNAASLTLLLYPVGTMAGSRRKNAATVEITRHTCT
jgi:hypothetical protein